VRDRVSPDVAARVHCAFFAPQRRSPRDIVSGASVKQRVIPVCIKLLLAQAPGLEPGTRRSTAPPPEATLNGNTVLVRSLDIVRAIFGATAPQYKQFVMRAVSPADAEQENQEAQTGEAAAPGAQS
jgi:hypothetical protein